MAKIDCTDKNKEILKEYKESRKKYISLLVENNLDLIDRAVEKFYIEDILSIEDFRQDCYIILYEAIDKWLDSGKELKTFRQGLGNTLNHKCESLNKKYLGINNEVDSGLDFCIDVLNIDDAVNFDWVKENLDNDLKIVLTERQYDIVCTRFGLHGEEPKTLEEVRKIFGVNKEGVRQLEIRALRKLRSDNKFKKKYEGVLW